MVAGSHSVFRLRLKRLLRDVPAVDAARIVIHLERERFVPAAEIGWPGQPAPIEFTELFGAG